MDLVEYQRMVAAIGFGKRLPTALYVFRDGDVSGLSGLGAELDRMVAQMVLAFQIGPEFNVLKFRSDELKVSFLCYPRFFEDPHPALRHAITLDLVRGKARHTDYEGNPNPPILHRKEAFLPLEHSKRSVFVALTEAEEAEGLYAYTATIGFKLNWERLVEAKGLGYKGHRLVREGRGKAESRKQKAEIGWPQEGARNAEQKAESRNAERGEATDWAEDGAAQAGRAVLLPSAGMPVQVGRVVVERHKTAMVRYDLSKPVRTLLEYGQLRAGTSAFDYGCGQGADVVGLRNLGYSVEGWDPVHRPETAKVEADVVNLGYVLNVIEDPAERLETLVDAFRHARRLLVVSALINETVDTGTARRYGDGVLTRANTFQKFFEQQELQQYIEDALEATAVPVSLGVFYVFRDPVEQQDFMEARTRRTIDWTQISARLGLGAPQTMWKALYDEHKDLLDGFGKLALGLGRMPELAEFDRLAELSELLGSAKRALRAYVQGSGAEGLDWEAVRVRFGIGQPPKRRWEIVNAG